MKQSPAIVGQVGKLRATPVNRRNWRVTNPPQDAILPHGAAEQQTVLAILQGRGGRVQVRQAD